MPAYLAAAVRRLARTPTWSTAAILTFALAIGASLAVFEQLQAVLWRSLPYPEADRLVLLWEGQPDKGRARFGASAPMLRDWQTELSSFSSVTGFFESAANLAGGHSPERVRVVQATADLLATLGVHPQIGRGFERSDERNAAPVCLLSHEFWQSAFAGDPQIVGREVRLGNESLTVIGVLPAEIGEPFDDPALFRTLSLAGDERRGARWLRTVARLAPGVSPEAAAAELDALARRLAEAHPDSNRGWRPDLVPLAGSGVEGARSRLLPLAAAAALVLLLACANVATLALVRTVSRLRETAIRQALGGDGWQLLRPLLAEALVVGACAAVLGVALAAASHPILAPLSIRGGRSAALTLAPRTLLLALLLSLLCSALIAGIPLLSRRRSSTVALLRASGADSASPHRQRLRRGLVVFEIACAAALLVSAGLLGRSVARLLAVEPGFATAGALVARVAPPQTGPSEGLERAEALRRLAVERVTVGQFYDRLRERLEASPQVRAVGAINRLPMTGNWWRIEYGVPGQPPRADGEPSSAYGRVVTPGYFAAIGQRMLAGRDFDASDRADSLPVVVIDEALARVAFAGEEPIGRTLTIDRSLSATIVGIAADTRLSGPDQPPPPTFYVPMTQAEFGFYPDWGMDLVIATPGDPSLVAPRLREELRALDPSLPLFAVRPLSEVLGARLAPRRTLLQLLSAFSAVALALAAIGLYGVLAQLGRERLREYGIRLALGARAAQLSRKVLRESLGLAAAGIVLGLLASAVVSRLLARMLYGVGGADPATLVGVSLLLVTTALLAALPTAVRALRTDPAVTLRDL